MILHTTTAFWVYSRKNYSLQYSATLKILKKPLFLMQTSDLFTPQTAHFPFPSHSVSTQTPGGMLNKERKSKAAALNVAHASFKMHAHERSDRNNFK